MSATAEPLISVVILNYNGATWLRRCLDSLQRQTLFDRIEVIVADNQSTDGSDRLAAQLLTGWSNGRFVPLGQNWGYCEGNNRGAQDARGRFLFFLNNDTWLEPDCLEALLREVEAVQADGATPLMLNYDDDSVQTYGGAGFDIFGCLCAADAHTATREVFAIGGCSLLIRRELFDRIGRFDAEFFMYADEYDLSWRLWLAGGRAVTVPASRLHHRGAANVNPEGGAKVVEFRTSVTKRYFANRNNLLVLLKNCQHALLLTVPLNLLMLGAEAIVWFLWLRQWAFVQRAYLQAIRDCWRLRRHIWAERQRIARFRRRSDWQMLRFLRWRPNRWDELQRLRQWGLPKVS